MITKENVKTDLKNIRVYYSRKDYFDKVFQTTEHNVAEKSKMYNDLMKDESMELFDLYYAIYITNLTQELYSEKLGVSAEYVHKLNKKLVNILTNKINAMEVTNNG